MPLGNENVTFCLTLAAFWKSTRDREARKTWGGVGGLCCIPEPWDEKWPGATSRQVQRLYSHTCPGTSLDVDTSTPTFSKTGSSLWFLVLGGGKLEIIYWIATKRLAGLMDWWGLMCALMSVLMRRWDHNNRNEPFRHFQFWKCPLDVARVDKSTQNKMKKGTFRLSGWKEHDHKSVICLNYSRYITVMVM